jgi:predicted nuclease of predicted toxin-antitoxin system
MKFSQITFLTDENISTKVLEFLRERGLEVIDVREQKWQGSSDIFLLKETLHTNSFIITFDADFGTLAINKNVPFFGILYLRSKNLKSENTIRILRKLITKNPEIEPGTIIVADENKVRFRKV